MDIVPQAVALHPFEINALAGTKCLRWIFTGGPDGIIRKYDLHTTIAKSSLSPDNLNRVFNHI